MILQTSLAQVMSTIHVAKFGNQAGFLDVTVFELTQLILEGCTKTLEEIYTGYYYDRQYKSMYN